MPWGVGKRGSCPAGKPWAVFLKDGGKVVGCHETRERALAHQRALYAQESAAYPVTPGEEPAMRENLIAPVLEWKAAGGHGELEGHCSVFGNVDQGGDVVLPGAFRKTLADWRGSRQPMPLIADHELSTDGVIGSVRDAREDAIGLWIRAGFSSDPKAQSVRTKMIEGHLKGMSFSYDAVRHYPGQVAGKAVRYLQELKLFEATVTPFPMNTLALASAKADVKKPYGDVAYADPGYLDADGNQASKSGKPGVARYPLSADKVMAAWTYINQAKNAAQYTAEQLSAIKGRIRAAMKKFGHQVSEAASFDFAQVADAWRQVLDIGHGAARKAAGEVLLAEWRTYDDDDAAGPADEPEPTADAAVPAGGTADNTTGAAFAAALIARPSGPHDGAPGGEPPAALAGPLAQLEVERAAREQDRLEAEIQDILGGTA